MEMVLQSLQNTECSTGSNDSRAQQYQHLVVESLHLIVIPYRRMEGYNAGRELSGNYPHEVLVMTQKNQLSDGIS